MSAPKRVVIAATVALLATGCGSPDPTESDEYAALGEERDELQARLDESDEELDRVDDALAVAESKLAEAEAEVARLGDEQAAAEAQGEEFAELLRADLMHRVGMDDSQAACAAETLADDDDARTAYLFLITGSDGDEDAAAASLDVVSAVFADCGVNVESADRPPIDEEALGEVTVEGVALPRFDSPTDDPAVGTVAPVIVGADYDGNPVTIDAAADGPTMVMVLAHWCPHCNAEIPRVNQLRDEGGIPDGVNIVAVSTGISPDGPNYPPGEWIETSGWTFPVLADGIDLDNGSFVAGAAYGTNAFPFVVLLDGEGRVVSRWAGETDGAALDAALATLADG